VLVATLATLVIGVGFVTTSELMRYSPGGAANGAASSAAAWGLADSRPSAAVTHPALGVPLRAIDEVARSLRAAGDGGRRLAVFGVSRNVGTTLSAVTLARALARDAKVVLIDLAVGAPNIAAISADPNAPGVAEVVRGMASFGDVITRDKLSRVHLVGAGRVGSDGPAIVASQRLAMMVEALARSYDHVIIDSGATFEAPVERLYRLAPRAILVATDELSPATRAARDRLAAAGYGEIAVLDGAATAAAAVAA
jgi:Mrp family chromosome partitioning ATPase